ncbi:glycosyltransferase [Agromyces mediolanus]|uniref:glycosyltransferase n=1 Tax=Agromyces mediolanus TaxID=41986 RepID=UPI00383660F9
MSDRGMARAAPVVRMPRGRQFAVTWAIPSDYGGMTQAMLARCASFARLGGTPVEVLTFDAHPDVPGLEAGLRSRGALAHGVSLVNLYEWLREHPLPGGSLRLDRDAFTPLDDAGADELLRRGDRVVARLRHDDAGRLLQIDHLRADGTLVLSDRRDARERGAVGGRSVVLCDESGAPVRSWARVWHLYTAWLDALTAGERSFMIVDSKTIAPFMLGYRRKHVVTAHVVHASHRSGRGETHPVRASRREVFDRIDEFDLVALLSKRQAEEVAELVGERPNVVVIPNARPARQGSAPTIVRPRSGGVVLAALTRRKRVQDAVRAMTLANAEQAQPVRLDVYGDGECRAEVEALAAKAPGVRLHGYDPTARQHLDGASFLLLTSRSEGFPLVLVESMAAGCLPIAYDIRYGPADLIRDGRTGFLVPEGDVEGLARAVRRLEAMPAARVAAMRRRAMQAARDFDEERVVAKWSLELTRALERRQHRRPSWRLRLRRAVSHSPLGPVLRTVLRPVRAVRAHR